MPEQVDESTADNKEIKVDNLQGAPSTAVFVTIRCGHAHAPLPLPGGLPVGAETGGGLWLGGGAPATDRWVL
jgi:hypothetical protein